MLDAASSRSQSTSVPGVFRYWLQPDGPNRAICGQPQRTTGIRALGKSFISRSTSTRASLKAVPALAAMSVLRTPEPVHRFAEYRTHSRQVATFSGPVSVRRWLQPGTRLSRGLQPTPGNGEHRDNYRVDFRALSRKTARQRPAMAAS